jgi:transcriptional antiterminator RfaH
MSYWACAQLETHHERLALHCLEIAGYQVYAPRIATGRRSMPTVLLFPGYAFVEIVSGWWQARWAAGVIKLVTCGGAGPAHVPDQVIANLRKRERNGLVVLSPPPRLQRGDQVQILHGPFAGHLALYDGQRPYERVMVLLALLGSVQRVELSKRDVKPAPAYELRTRN